MQGLFNQSKITQINVNQYIKYAIKNMFLKSFLQTW